MENKFQAKTLQRRNVKNLTLGGGSGSGNTPSKNSAPVSLQKKNAVPSHRPPPSPPALPPPVPPHRKPPPPPPPQQQQQRSSPALVSTSSSTSLGSNQSVSSVKSAGLNMSTSSIRSRRNLKNILPLDINSGMGSNSNSNSNNNNNNIIRSKAPMTILDEQRPTLINIRDPSASKTSIQTVTTTRRPPPPDLGIQTRSTDSSTVNSFPQLLLASRSTSTSRSASPSLSLSTTSSTTSTASNVISNTFSHQDNSASTISIPLAYHRTPSASVTDSDSDSTYQQTQTQTQTQRQPTEFKLEDLVQLGKLGEGNSGTVQKVLHVPSSTVLSKKTIPIENNNDTVKRQILRELSIVRTIKPHPNIISFYGAYVRQGSSNELIILMEFMDCGSLDKILKVYRHFQSRDSAALGKPTESWFSDPLVLSKIAYGVLNGLSYLYNNYKIIHRDIKPSNVLVGSHGEIKLCDFGVSKRVVNSIANTFVGTSTYMSPERIQGNVYSTKGDVWSLGLMLIELVTGEFPLGGDKNTPDGVLDLLQRIVNEPPPRLPDDDTEGPEGTTKHRYPPDFRDFVNKCCVKNARDRSSLQELLQHAFIVKYRGTGEREFRHWCKFVKAKIKEDKQIRREMNERAKLEKQQQQQKQKQKHADHQ